MVALTVLMPPPTSTPMESGAAGAARGTAGASNALAAAMHKRCLIIVGCGKNYARCCYETGSETCRALAVKLGV